jgi:hypothetical protein
MSAFRDRFRLVVNTLRNHPRVALLAHELRPPAPRAAIERAEAAIGRKLPRSIRDFYRAHDGAFLLWGLAGKTYQDVPSAFGFPDYGAPPGCINLLPIEEAMSASWESDSHVNEADDDQWEHLFGVKPAEEIRPRAVIADNFSRYHHGDLILGPEPVMIVSTDHGVDMDASDFMSFDTYLDCTLSVFGTNRYQAFGIGWSRHSQRIEKWDKRPGLDELLAAIEKDEE